MKIVVTGCDGQLGKQIIKQINKENKTLKNEIFALNREKLDICDIDKVNSYILSINPDIIINCAAFTKVDLCEDEVELAYKVNSIGPKNLAICCEKVNAKLVHISTDYVFDGNKNVPYEVFDRPNPINNYGKTKLQGEELVQKYCKKYYIIRTSWLYGHHGKNFVEAMLELAEEKKEIKVVDDQKGSPTWTVDLANGIVDIIENEICGIYHISGKGEATWFDFAKEIFQHKSANVNLISCSTKDFLCVANRPQYSVLNSSIKTRNWKTALKDYLELRIEDMDL